MKKIGIITIYDNDNYGNRLQNYAVQQIFKKRGYEVETIKNEAITNNIKQGLINKVKTEIILRLKLFKEFIKIKTKRRYKYFKTFNKENIKFRKNYITGNNALKIGKQYQYFIVGSDQVWNPKFKRLTDIDLLNFMASDKKISLSASFAIKSVPENKKEFLKNNLTKFKAISVREYSGKEIIENIVNRKDVEVLVDPTMMLTSEEWDRIIKKPKQLKIDKYILSYFLGELTENRKKEINRVAKENECEVINILDKKSPYYQTGPSEFLYLEKNAFLICTDSFHSSIFAILYNKPFIIFNREEKKANMNSRIETLIKKFGLENRMFKGEIIEKNLKHNYIGAYKILEDEREKMNEFLDKALNEK